MSPIRLLIALAASLPSLACLGQDVAIPLKVDSGVIADGRDTRIFSVPVEAGNEHVQFTWACGGWTTIRESFARKLALTIQDDDETADITDASGQRMFLGAARMTVSFGGLSHRVLAKVQRDAAYNRGLTGIIGYDIASRFQWEMNPDAKKPTLTLRLAGTHRPENPLASIPLRDESDNLWIPVTIRNVKVDVLLAPQLSDIQAAPDLQKAWDIETGQGSDVASEFGALRTRKLVGARDWVQLAENVRETGCTVILVGDKDHPERTPGARSGLGQSFLNRFVYCVDPRIGRFWILRRVPAPAAPPVP